MFGRERLLYQIRKWLYKKRNIKLLKQCEKTEEKLRKRGFSEGFLRHRGGIIRMKERILAALSGEEVAPLGEPLPLFDNLQYYYIEKIDGEEKRFIPIFEEEKDLCYSFINYYNYDSNVPLWIRRLLQEFFLKLGTFYMNLDDLWAKIKKREKIENFVPMIQLVDWKEESPDSEDSEEFKTKEAEELESEES